MLDSYDTEIDLLENFVEAIHEIPNARTKIKGREIATSERGTIDAVVELYLASEKHTLLIEAKRSVFPRDVRQAIWQMNSYKSGSNSSQIKNAHMILIAEAISPGAREILRQEEIGYYDRGGSLFLPMGGAFIYIDKPAPRPMKKEYVSVFKGARSRVLKSLFSMEREWTNVKEITQIARVSQATVSQTLQELERREWVEVRGGGPAKLRRLEQPGEILDAWVGFLEDQKPPEMRRFYIPHQDADHFVFNIQLTLKEHGILNAYTGLVGAQAYSPYLTKISQLHCRLCSNKQEYKALTELDAKSVTEGWNFAIIDVPANDFIGTEQINNLQVCSPLQIYLDLVHESGRAKEIAQHLRSERLQF
ncbi:MAG: hypothetical protein COA41_07115 [Sphingopyxis sp.]|nr:MAG: hypothetical protein COA41_07115 [Sphingopyxis sp.]